MIDQTKIEWTSENLAEAFYILTLGPWKHKIPFKLQFNKALDFVKQWEHNKLFKSCIFYPYNLILCFTIIDSQNIDNTYQLNEILYDLEMTLTNQFNMYFETRISESDIIDSVNTIMIFNNTQ